MLVATQRKEGWLRSLLRIAGSAAERHRAMELLDFVGIARLAHDPAGTLSYGQRKLLELASLLVADPDVLLLDEPAGGVNPTLITHLADRIKELNQQGKTFLVVEHNMEFVMNLCHRVTVLSQGTPLVSGTPAEVRSNPAVLDAYLGGEDDAATQRELAEGTAGARRASPALSPQGRDSAAPAARAGAAAPDRGRDRRLRRRRHPQAGQLRCARGRHHLHRRAQRRGQVDAALDDQRSAPPAAGGDPLPRQADLRALPAPDPRSGHRPGPAGPQPVPGDDGARERRDGCLHDARPAPGPAND